MGFLVLCAHTQPAAPLVFTDMLVGYQSATASTRKLAHFSHHQTLTAAYCWCCNCCSPNPGGDSSPVYPAVLTIMTPFDSVEDMQYVGSLSCGVEWT